jgi:hypothetical protein
VFPPNDPAYGWLAAGQCQTILDRVVSWQENGVPEVDLRLYRGAASACLSDWKVAIEDLEALREHHQEDLEGIADPVECKDSCPRCQQIVFQWLSAVVDAHQNDPEQPLSFTPSSKPPLCPDTSTTTTTSEGTRD